MLSEWIHDAYSPQNREEAQEALREVMQQIALAGLHRAGFFEHAAFYGGTALRIFYGLPRFSEDLDFSLLQVNPDFEMARYLKALEKECEALGIEVTTRTKTKTVDSDVDSAFLKSTTMIKDLLLTTNEYQPGQKERISIKIKLEVDTNPPLGFATEERLMLKPYTCYIKCFTLGDLMAGKLHALLFRQWKNRVKGRDWFDLEWYISKGTKVHLDHFAERAIQSGHWPERKHMTRKELVLLLEQRIAEVNFDQARADVERFVENPAPLQQWSRPYFMDLIQHLKVD